MAPEEQPRDADQMEDELEAITQKLRVLKRTLDARRSLTDEPDAGIAGGDPVDVNPLTRGALNSGR
jgi:hypothetical protein